MSCSNGTIDNTSNDIGSGKWPCKIDIDLNLMEFKLHKWPDGVVTGTDCEPQVNESFLFACVCSVFNISAHETSAGWISTTQHLVKLPQERYICTIVNQSFNCDCMIHVYIRDHLITLDITTPKFNHPVVQQNLIIELTRIADSLQKRFNATSIRPYERLSVLPRLSVVPKLFIGSRRELRVHDFTQILFDEQSEHQSVRILAHPECGNTLVLDDEINLAESDTVYTQSLMRLHQVDYNNKQVLILGGGDGALLYQILKHHTPTFVTMLELDETVIQACRQHMRSVCGPYLDKYNGDNYQIKIGDCFPVLETYAIGSKQFDVIIADLTDRPVVPADSPASMDGGAPKSVDATYWEDSLLEAVITRTLPLLAADGYLLAHIGGAGNDILIGCYQAMLRKFNLKFDKLGFLPNYQANVTSNLYF